MKFEENASNLKILYDETFGGYLYRDRFSSVLYSKLSTPIGIVVPRFAVFTASPNKTEMKDFRFSGVVSSCYSFVGNEILVDGLRKNLNEENLVILDEKYSFDQKMSSFRGEISVKNKKNLEEVGNIYPQFVVTNSYISTKAINLFFGIVVESDSGVKKSFTFHNAKINFGSARQIHHLGHSVKMRSCFGEYVEMFNNNILDLITTNMNTKIDDSLVFSVLDMIKKTGDRRKETFSGYISKVTNGGKDPMTAWNLFNIILSFSNQEKNLNIKTILENMAETVMIIPQQMISAVQKMNARLVNNI